jgi:ABC-type lipoprotein release transport system permease subunit
VGALLARNLRIGVGDELVLLGSGRDGSMAATVLPVVGIFTTGAPDIDRHMVQMPLATFQDVFAMGDHGHVIVVNARELDALGGLLAEVRALLPAGGELVALPWEEVLTGLKQLMQADMVQNWFMYLSLIVIVTFSILNTFLMAVLERTREFGVMLALGLRPLRIGAVVMLESLLLTLLGLAIGIAVGGGVVVYYYFAGFTFQAMEEIYAQFGLPGVIVPELSFVTLTLGPAVILAFTLLASLYPALRIRRLQPVDAMRAV